MNTTETKAPEAPLQYNNTEASCWQIGWEEGYEKCQSRILDQIKSRKQKIVDCFDGRQLFEKTQIGYDAMMLTFDEIIKMIQ